MFEKRRILLLVFWLNYLNEGVKKWHSTLTFYETKQLCGMPSLLTIALLLDKYLKTFKLKCYDTTQENGGPMCKKLAF